MEEAKEGRVKVGGSQERKQASWEVYIRENRTICPFGLIVLVGQDWPI